MAGWAVAVPWVGEDEKAVAMGREAGAVVSSAENRRSTELPVAIGRKASVRRDKGPNPALPARAARMVEGNAGP